MLKNAEHHQAFHMKMGAPLSSSTSSRSPRSWAKSSVISLPLFIILAISLTSSSCNAETVLNYDDLNFTPWNELVSYVSSDVYYARGMGPLYQSVNEIIRSFIDKEPIPPGYIEIKDSKIVLGEKSTPDFQPGDLLKKYWGIVLVFAIGALLIVLMPIIGLCFCCCRCAGACGGRSEPFDKKHDTCRRVVWGLLLICAATGLLFGVIVAFVTNSYMQEGVDNLTPTIRNGMDDTKTYLESTKSHMDYLLKKNYAELSENIASTLKRTADVLLTDLKNASKAISLDNLNRLVEKLPTIKANLGTMKVLTNDLRVHASQLSDGLRGVKRELLLSLAKCSAKPCSDVLDKYHIGELDASGIDYNQLPDVSNQIASVENLLEGDILNIMKKAMDSFDNMSETLNGTIQENTEHVITEMEKAGDGLTDATDLMEEYLEKVKTDIVRYTKEGTDHGDEYIEKYSIYRFYFGVAVSTVLLLILACITFALLCGICGKRPDGYGDDCCNKGAGSRFLMIAVALIFLTISALCITVIVHFIVGIVARRAVCVSLSNPANDELFAYVDQIVDLNKLYDSVNNDKKFRRKNSKLRSSTRVNEKFTVSDVIVSCNRNESIYQVLRLKNIVNIDDILNYLDSYNINQTLEHLIATIDIKEVEILNPDIDAKLTELAKSDLGNLDVYKFTDNLHENMTRYPLTEIADKLKETAEEIPKNSAMAEIKISLRNQALHLETYHAKLVDPMISESKRLKELAQQIDADLRFNSNATDKEPFETAINNLRDELGRAQAFIKDNGTPYVKKIARKLVDQLITAIDKYMNLVVKSVGEDIGRCGPIANVYSSLIVAGCNQIVDPFNGFWASVGWCILLFLPTLIISVKLSSLYQKSDPYPGPLVESEYLYDAYSERDNIPLANGPKNKRRKTKERRGGSRDRRDYYEDSGSSHGVPASRDTRYNDMAPKHWDGGPPRYQNPPMAPPASEYERPPPYYYPGASEQD